MRLIFLNSEYGIVGIESINDLEPIHIQKLKELCSEGNRMDDLVFYYIWDRNLIALNMRHKLYKEYLDIISAYMDLNDEHRAKVRDEAPRSISRCLYQLEDIIESRKEKKFANASYNVAC